MQKKDRKEYYKEYYMAHKEEMKAYHKAWFQENREEQKAKNKDYYKAHKEELKARCRAWGQAHREELNSYRKAWRQAHKEEYKDYQKAYHKAYSKADTNSLGQTKQNIRVKSSYYLFNVLKHTKIDGYEIHHCFGYEDYKKFIYIPKELHIQIHQFLRDNGIDADTDHYNQIEHLIVNYLKFKEMHVLVLR